jgi:hypothetical protein
MISAKKTKQENQTGKETNYFHKLGKVNETGVLKGGDSLLFLDCVSQWEKLNMQPSQ